MKNKKEKTRTYKGPVLKNKKIGLYNPYLDVMGGGEKHILSIIDVLVENGAEAYIFWDKNLSQELEQRLSLQCFKTLKWRPRYLVSSSSKAFQTLHSFDYFFYVTDGSYFFSSAKKNFVFCMVPDKKLYNLNFLNRLKLINYKFISNSPYTTKWLIRWGINPLTITPYIDELLFKTNKNKKQKVILSVGRFFSHLHSKNQEKIIETFKLLKQSNWQFKDYRLILSGGLKKEDQEYFNRLKLLAKNDPSIILRPNVSLYELYELYELSNYFWHFTGLGVDEENHPEAVEHFGIAPLEAIASGCLTFCHNSGGPKEILKNEETAFLFNSEGELIKIMTEIEENKKLKNKVITKGAKFVKDNYNCEIFRKKVLAIL